MKRAEEVSPQKENNYWLPGIMGREEWSDSKGYGVSFGSDKNVWEWDGMAAQYCDYTKKKKKKKITELYTLKWLQWWILQYSNSTPI